MQSIEPWVVIADALLKQLPNADHNRIARLSAAISPHSSVEIDPAEHVRVVLVLLDQAGVKTEGFEPWARRRTRRKSVKKRVIYS